MSFQNPVGRTNVNAQCGLGTRTTEHARASWAPSTHTPHSAAPGLVCALCRSAGPCAPWYLPVGLLPTVSNYRASLPGSPVLALTHALTRARALLASLGLRTW